MPQNFLYPQRDQPLLMPVDTREWLPEGDLVFVVLDAVATLDLGAFYRHYRADGHGRAAFGTPSTGARPSPLAIPRNDLPAASPREISSRSAGDNRNGERFGSRLAGRCHAITARRIACRDRLISKCSFHRGAPSATSSASAAVPYN